MPEDRKTRVAAAAKRSGTHAHGFILEAIAEKAEQTELRTDFDAVAEDRYARIVASGKTIPWHDRLLAAEGAPLDAELNARSTRPRSRHPR